MSSLPLLFVIIATVVALSLRRSRWRVPSLRVSRFALALLLVQAVLYFPVKSGFRLSPPDCQWTFNLALAIHSLTNYPHIVLFTLFFLLMYAQLPGLPTAMRWSAAATLVLGLFIELAQGVTGHGHCRMRDLIPDSVGVLLGAGIVFATSKIAQWKTQRR